MPDTNVTVVGNCTRVPELRFSNAGKPITNLSVAVTSRRKNASGNWENGDSSFFDVVCFDRLAENVSESVQKGQRISVTGSLKQSSWEKDGQKRSKVEIVADDVALSLRWDAIVPEGAKAVMPRASKNQIEDEPF
jgi:single-strand DNA-binding protein